MKGGSHFMESGVIWQYTFIDAGWFFHAVTDTLSNFQEGRKADREKGRQEEKDEPRWYNTNT